MSFVGILIVDSIINYGVSAVLTCMVFLGEKCHLISLEKYLSDLSNQLEVYVFN